MEIPKHLKTYDLTSSTVWFNEEGILFSKPKPDAPVSPSNEEIKVDMDRLRGIIGNRKVCLVGESNPNSKPPKKEQRDYIADEISSITKAMALVASSPVSRMLANLFFSFKPPNYPIKMFSTEAEAVSWIRQYL